MLSVEICAQKKGSSMRRISEFQSSSPRCTPMGFLRSSLSVRDHQVFELELGNGMSRVDVPGGGGGGVCGMAVVLMGAQPLVTSLVSFRAC
jgi:hypothetical protein